MMTMLLSVLTKATHHLKTGQLPPLVWRSLTVHRDFNLFYRKVPGFPGFAKTRIDKALQKREVNAFVVIHQQIVIMFLLLEQKSG